MSAHRLLYDLYKAAFETTNPPDVLSGSAIQVTHQDEVFPLNSANAAQALTLVAPNKAGLRITLACVAYTSAITVVVSNYDDSTYTLTFTATGKIAKLESVPVSVGTTLGVSSINNYNWIVTFSNL